MQPLWQLRDAPPRRRRQDPRWAAAQRYLPGWGTATEAPLGTAPVVAVQGNRVHLLLLGLRDRLPQELTRALGAPIALHPETTSALNQLCWHLPRWLPVLAAHRGRRATDLQLFSVDSWDPTQPAASATHAPPPRVDGRSLLLSALAALVSDLVDVPVARDAAFSADIDFASGRLAPVIEPERKWQGLRVMLPNLRQLFTAPTASRSDHDGICAVSRVEHVLEALGLSAALVEQLRLHRDRPVRQLVAATLAGRALLHSWNAIAGGATTLLPDAPPQERVLLRFVRAVALRHDGRDPAVDDMPPAGVLCEAAQATGLNLDPDEVRAHWVQHHTDLILDAEPQAHRALAERVEAIVAQLQADHPVWPAALKLLGAWARHRGVLGPPQDGPDALALSALCCDRWLRARLGHEASYPLSEVWRLTGALPFDPATYAAAAALHTRWTSQPGAVTADNLGFVHLAALRACVLLLEEGHPLSRELVRCLGLPDAADPTAALDEALQRVASGQVSPDLPHLRAAACRWQMRLRRAWPEHTLAQLRTPAPVQAWLAEVDAMIHRDSTEPNAPRTLPPLPAPHIGRLLHKRAAHQPGPALRALLRATPY